MRAPREAPPPTRYGRTRSGTAFRILSTGRRDAQGRKLYRLMFYGPQVKGNGLWTLDALRAAGVKFLQRIVKR